MALWRKHWPSVVLLAILAGGLTWSLYEGPAPPTALALLLPDDADANSASVRAWRLHAHRLGLPLAIIRDDTLLRPSRRMPVRLAGLIVPDELHPIFSSALIDRLQTYVAQGGQLMMVYDAGTRGPPGLLERPREQLFAQLTGIAPTAYRDAPASATAVLPPARRTLPLSLQVLAFRSANGATPDRSGGASGGMGPAPPDYTHLKIGAAYRGEVMLRAVDGSPVVGVHTLGKGQVAFVNLALGNAPGGAASTALPQALSWFGRDLCGLVAVNTSTLSAQASPLAHLPSLKLGATR